MLLLSQQHDHCPVVKAIGGLIILTLQYLDGDAVQHCIPMLAKRHVYAALEPSCSMKLGTFRVKQTFKLNLCLYNKVCKELQKL